MKKTFIKTLFCAVGVAVLSSRNAAAQVVVYSNVGSYDYNAFFLGSAQNGQSIGNEITVNAGVSSLTSFSILYYTALPTLPANVGVDIRFSLNDGSLFNGYYPEPNTVFFDSGWRYNTSGAIPGNGYNYLSYSAANFSSGALDNWSPNFVLPSDFTFSITWTNLTSGNEIAMPLALNTPGVSTGNYWFENNGSWSLLTNTVTGPGNLVVDIEVPEPSFFALGMTSIGGVLLFGSKKLRRKV